MQKWEYLFVRQSLETKDEGKWVPNEGGGRSYEIYTGRKIGGYRETETVYSPGGHYEGPTTYRTVIYANGQEVRSEDMNPGGEDVNPGGMSLLHRYCQELGELGWELISTDAAEYAFKRPKQ